MQTVSTTPPLIVVVQVLSVNGPLMRVVLDVVPPIVKLSVEDDVGAVQVVTPTEIANAAAKARPIIIVMFMLTP